MAETLRDDTQNSWGYLKGLPDRFGWLAEAFGSPFDFVVAINAYRWQLTFLEFANQLKTDTLAKTIRAENIYLEVPPTLLLEPTAVLTRSFSMAFADREAVQRFCRVAGVDIEAVLESWGEWVKLMKRVLQRTRPDIWFHEDDVGPLELPAT